MCQVAIGWTLIHAALLLSVIQLGAVVIGMRSSLLQAVPADEIRLIRDALQRGQLTGTSRFVDESGADCWCTDRATRTGTSRAGIWENKSCPLLVLLVALGPDTNLFYRLAGA